MSWFEKIIPSRIKTKKGNAPNQCLRVFGLIAQNANLICTRQKLKEIYLFVLNATTI
jgi:hypothetical protein